MIGVYTDSTYPTQSCKSTLTLYRHYQKNILVTEKKIDNQHYNISHNLIIYKGLRPYTNITNT